MLETDLLSPLMCVKIDVLFTTIRVVGCGAVVSAAATINNGCKFECSVAGLHNKNEEWGMLCESLRKCTQGCNIC